MTLYELLRKVSAILAKDNAGELFDYTIHSMDNDGGFLRSRFCYSEKVLSDFKLSDDLKTILIALDYPFDFCNSTQYYEEGDFSDLPFTSLKMQIFLHDLSNEEYLARTIRWSCAVGFNYPIKVDIINNSFEILPEASLKTWLENANKKKLQEFIDSDKIEIGCIVKIAGEDTVGIVKDIDNDSNIEVDIYYKEDNYLVEPHQKNVKRCDISIADDDDFRVGYLKYLSRRKYLHVYSQRDKERMSAVLHQIKKVWETCPDLRLGQLLMCCCANDRVMFDIEDEMLMERLQKMFLDKN